MDAPLKAQIVERFGRDIMNLPAKGSVDMRDLEQFMHSYQNWLHRRLNDLSDLYACPVCYTWLQRQSCGCDYSRGVPELSSADPMAVLQRQSVRYSEDVELADVPLPEEEDEEEARPRMAAPICFRRLVDVKSHLAAEHGLDPKDVKDSQFWQRYKVRATDGLLQK
jgi:hypothetical protein